MKIFWKKCPPTERPADRGISRPAGRERLADRRFSGVITFWTLKIFGKKCRTERAADRRICRPAGRERLTDRGFFPSDRREHSPGLGIFYRDRLFREEVTLQWKKRPVEGLFGRARSRSIRGRGISHCDHLLDFENFSKFPVGRDTRRSGSLSTGRSRTTRRWRIFQRNHLLDSVKISKYFKVRSGKRFAHRGLVPMLGPNGLADGGSSGVITFWTWKICGKFSTAGDNRSTEDGGMGDRRTEEESQPIVTTRSLCGVQYLVLF